ncbi:hypothetical protein AVEN_155297-1 [Araneus ventricosus]|uniref:Uncharacterized protein n=1 Tax=Araneus ventricosus TaxID=182803 RepID=A0A4Y2D8J1_ARAVE|nr:hypothetical protein AVEN_155297-1 [Araneus ventricosus]
MCRLPKTVHPVRSVVAVWHSSGQSNFYRSRACLQKVISGRGLNSRLPRAKMHLAFALPYRTVARWTKAVWAGRKETADLHRTCRQSIPQHQIGIVSGLLPIHCLWNVRE